MFTHNEFSRLVDNEGSNKEENLFTVLMNKYLPFWPLFAVLLATTSFGAWLYLHYAPPIFEVSASLIIKDENKGVDDPSITESINIFKSKKIVENEIEVIHSRTLMNKVVNELHLYAPIFEKGQLRSFSAYSSSPVVVELKDPEKLPEHIEEYPEIYFIYDTAKNEIRMDNRYYPLNQWHATPYGVLQFSLNSKKSKTTINPLYFSLVHPKKITDDLLEKLEVSSTNKLSTVVDLSFKDPVPQRGVDILNLLIHSYNQIAITDRNNLAANTLAFIEDRMKYVEEELAQVEKEVQQYKSTKGVVDLSEQGKVYLESVAENDRKIADIKTQLAVLNKVETYVTSKDNKAGIVPSTLGVDDPVLSQLLEKLYDAEIEYEKLSKTTAENNPILVSVTNEIEKIRPSILENVHNQQISLQASLENLNSTRGKYNSALQTLPQKERELLEISRQQSIKNDAYSFLLQKREEAALSYAPIIGDSRVVDMAESSILPVSPKPLIIYAIAFIAAFALGIGFITGKEILNRKVLFRSEIEGYTAIPIVGELSCVKQKKGLSLEGYKEASTAEQFRHLRIGLGLHSRALNKKKVLVTSSIAGEGKSFVSANLALSLATSGKRVVLLDLDLRNPKNSIFFNVIEQKGITEYLVEELEPFEIIKATTYNNLHIVPVGNTSDNIAEILFNRDLSALFSYLEKEFDYIIIDTPPVDLVSDAYLLSEYCDTTLFIIRHAYTPKYVVQRLDQNSKVKSMKNMALVFNGLKSRGMVKGTYGYEYGYNHISKK